MTNNEINDILSIETNKKMKQAKERGKKMTGYDVINCNEINETDKEKVDQIVKSMLENGFVGCPILVYGESQLVTGSHRRQALIELDKMTYTDIPEEIEGMIENIMENDIAVDVQDIVDEWLEENETYDIPFDSLGQIFAGTWVEEYKEEIAEW